MSSQDELAEMRFGMTKVPKPGGQPGNYEERLSQWFLERSFFRDFTYRNPPKKKGEELADAVVLFEYPWGAGGRRIASRNVRRERANSDLGLQTLHAL
jgi:hypothetical protein